MFERVLNTPLTTLNVFQVLPITQREKVLNECVPSFVVTYCRP